MTTDLRTERLGMTLDDRLTQEEGWVYMTGMQALVRLPLQMAKRDRAAGLNSGGYISGYRGSPLGTYDMSLWAAEKVLAQHNIVFRPAVNEDLAATAIWGTQQIGLFPGAKVDGVFSIRYGKAPGVDRSMDALRHANLGGTSDKGGTLMLVGDDHGAKSSTVACSSDFDFVSLGVPLLAPANPQEVLDLGLHGLSMSRHTGTIVALKLVTDVIEGGGSVYVAPDSPAITIPQAPPKAGPAPVVAFIEQERRLWDERLKRARGYARANGLDQMTGAPKAALGIVSSGKSWQDLEQALAAMGYDGQKIGGTPIRLLKLGMIWPLDHEVVRDFARGLDTILVVEEKRPLIEDQIRALLYGQEAPPRIVGKTFGGSFYGAPEAECALPATGELTPGQIQGVIARVARETDPDTAVTLPNAMPSPSQGVPPAVPRIAAFCAGCPHGRSTQVIDGSRALAGIGCHTMAMTRDPSRTNSVSHMGGEGAMWIGQSPFTDEPHVFANMGDGTYFHSGLLAIRAAVAANVPMTYKLLHNGFVSMTGGQKVDGELSPEAMVAQVKAEGVRRVALVSDEPEKYAGVNFGAGVTLHPRTALEAVQRELRTIEGVTVLIYDQPCATERRRQRKRGTWPDPDLRVYINPEVCEGCGDCSTVSSCMAIEPLETPLGRKRTINQSACNKDFSCVEGFCPSFVTVSGAHPRKAQTSGAGIDISHLPLPAIPEIEGCYAILIAGIGGTGVVTLGQTLAVAAHSAGYFASNLDITGLSQKYGAVHSHVKIAARPELRGATRVAEGEAHAMIGSDLIVAASDDSLMRLDHDGALAVTDLTLVPTSAFSRDPDWQIDDKAQYARMAHYLGDRLRGIEAQHLAEQVMGDKVFANVVLLGAAWQQGAVPLPLAAIHHALELNGVQIAANKRAFDLGRLAYGDPAQAQRLLGSGPAIADQAHQDTAALIEDRAARLTVYGGEGLSRRYRDRLNQIAAAGLGDAALRAAAKGYYKLLAVKDEWEVARLYRDKTFTEGLKASFDGDLKLTFHLGSWPLGYRDRTSGKPVKRAIGGGLAMPLFATLNALRGLRGTVLDPFSYGAEAKLARRLLAEYEDDMTFALAKGPHAAITALLDLPAQIRGYGHVREKAALAAAARRADLRAQVG